MNAVVNEYFKDLADILMDKGIYEGFRIQYLGEAHDGFKVCFGKKEHIAESVEDAIKQYLDGYIGREDDAIRIAQNRITQIIKFLDKYYKEN